LISVTVANVTNGHFIGNHTFIDAKRILAIYANGGGNRLEGEIWLGFSPLLFLMPLVNFFGCKCHSQGLVSIYEAMIIVDQTTKSATDVAPSRAAFVQ
jgi:hypothetical protein